jgi:hypothetical protein
MRYYDTLAELDRLGFNVIVDKTWEDISPRDCFDDEGAGEGGLDQLCRDIDSGKYEWFMMRVRVMYEDVELASDYLGGMCYEDPTECLTDGTAEDIIAGCLDTAQQRVRELATAFDQLVRAQQLEVV